MSYTAPLSLAHTKRAEAWLENFAPADQPAAKLLLASITVIGETAFRADMKALLRQVSSSLAPASVATFAAQSVPRLLRSTGYYTDPTQLEPTGSELIIENILRKSRRRTKFMVSPSKDALLSQRADVLLFVADVLASGDELIGFIDFVYRNPSIRSWHSSEHVRFEVAAHTVSDAASDRIRRDKRIAGVHYLEVDRTLDRSAWSMKERAEVEDLCVRYADDPDAAFGRGGVRSMIAFGHTFGNGLPRILLQSHGPAGAAWTSFLATGRDDGLDPEDERLVSGFRPRFDMAGVLDGLRLQRATRALQKQERITLEIVGSGSIQGEAAIAELIVALRLGLRDDLQLMRATGTSSAELAKTKQRALTLGLIAADMRVTPEGASYIRRTGRNRQAVRQQQPTRVPGPYYPQQLR